MGTHRGEKIAELVAKLALNFEIEDRISVYVGDNTSNVNTIVKALVRRFQLEESKTGRRLRCYSYIINLAVKVFLLGADFKTFINEAEVVERAIERDEQNLAIE